VQIADCWRNDQGSAAAAIVSRSRMRAKAACAGVSTDVRSWTAMWVVAEIEASPEASGYQQNLNTGLLKVETSERGAA
jgi:hypothetical protein